MSKIIVLEGPDASGKTSLANYLCQELDAIYIHNSWYVGIDSTKEFDKCMNIAHQLKNKNINVIIDRLFLSEIIYADVYRTGSTIRSDKILEWERIIDLNILCLPKSPEFVIEQHNKTKNIRFEMYDNVEEVVKRYFGLWDNSYKFETSNETLNFIINEGGLIKNSKYIDYDWTNSKSKDTALMLLKKE